MTEATHTAQLLIHPECILGEGIQWNTALQRLFFTDIHGSRLLSCDADGGDLVDRPLPERLCAFAFDPDGHMLCGFESGLFRFDLAADKLERLTRFEPDQPTTRLNDGRCDRQGRFLIGGMNEDDLKPASSLIRYTGGATETLITGIGCSNSLSFSPNGRRMYHTDTPTRTIFTYAYNPETGALGPRETFAKLEDPQGFPDGSCADADSSLWNAEFNGSAVQEYRADGAKGRRITVDAPQVTCCCFGGPNLDRLYITTAREHMTSDQVTAAPNSGALFIADVGAQGLEETGFAERLFT